MLYELLHVLKSEDLASGSEQQLAHVFAPYAEATPGDARDHLKCRPVLRSVFGAEEVEVLNACDLVACRAVVLGEFDFDNDLRVELVGDNEVRCLVEAGNALRSAGLAIADPGAGQASSMALSTRLPTNSLTESR